MKKAHLDTENRNRGMVWFEMILPAALNVYSIVKSSNTMDQVDNFFSFQIVRISELKLDNSLQKRESKKLKKEAQPPPDVNVTIPAPDTESMASYDSFSMPASPTSTVSLFDDCKLFCNYQTVEFDKLILVEQHIILLNKKSKCSNDPCSPYLQSSPLFNQPVQMLRLFMPLYNRMIGQLPAFS